MLPNQMHYPAISQEFFWINSVNADLESSLESNLVACLERRETSNKLSGEIEVEY